MKTKTIPSAFNFSGRARVIATLGVAAAAYASSLSARADIEWQGPTASYTIATNWVGGVVPGATNNADNSNGTNNVLLINSGDPDWTITDLTQAGMAGTTGAGEQNGPTLNLNGWFHVGAGTNSTGIYTLDSGTINIPNGALFLNEGPGSTATLNINGGTINKGNTPANPFYIAVGNWNGNGARTGTVNQVAGTVNTTSETWIGQATYGTAFYNLHGGTFNSSNWFVVGRGGSIGTLTMDGGVINHYSGGQPALIVCDSAPAGGMGTLNFTGGTINTIGAEFWIANQGGATATVNLTAPAVLNAGSWLAIGRGGNGTLNINSGNINKSGTGNITLAGTSSTTTGTVVQNGGVVSNASSMVYVGESGTGSWTMNGGTNIFGQVIVCLNGTATGTLNLNGGFMQLTSINTGNALGFSTLSLNGTALQANSSTTNFISGMIQASVGSGGALIDSQAFSLTVPQALTDGGGGFLLKQGSGTLTMTGANSYSGSNIVAGGTLIMGTSSTTSGNVSVANGSGFGVTVQSANGQFSPAAATFGVSGATTLSFDLSSFGNPTSAPLNISSGPLTLNGTVTVNVADALPQTGQFPLIKYPSGGLAGSGTVVLGSLPVGVTAAIVMNTANNSIDLNITGVNQPRWDGNAGGTWDINVTTNWINIGTGAPTFYTDGSPVVFNDSATGTTTVSISQTVSPNKITITNTALPYSFVGAGAISGSTGVTKTGTNTLAILNTGGNNYTGPTLITGGSFTVTNLANGGAASAIGASSASPTNLVLASTTFVYAGPSVAINRGFQTSASIFDIEGNVSFGGTGTTTAGTLYKVGPATMTYAGVGTNVLSPANVGGAYQVQNGTTVLDGSAGTQTNSVIGELWVSSTTNYAGNLVVTNASLGISSWLALGRGNGSNNFASSVSVYNSLMNVSYGNTGAGGATQGGGVSLGYNNGLPNAGTQALNLAGTTSLTNLGGNFNISESTGSRSVMNLSNSAAITAIYARFAIGGTAANGVMNFNSTATSIACSTSGQIFLGGLNGTSDSGAGALNISSGMLKFGNTASTVYIALGDNVGTAPVSYGSLVLSGGTLSNVNLAGLRVGYGGYGSFVQSGGTLLNGGYLSIGGNTAGGTGVATFTGGMAGIYNNAYRVLLPDVANATAVFNMGTEAGGTAIFTNLYSSGGASFIMENNAGGNGTLNLNSGTLQLPAAIHRANTSGGSAVVNLNGGTLQANATGTALIDTSLSSVNMFKGGVTVDSVANATTVSGNLLTTFGNGIYPAGGTLTIAANGGTGYIGAPLVTVSGGTGSGAMAIASVSNGIITNVVMTCPGQNYVAGDVVTFTFAAGGSKTLASNYVYTLQAGDVAANAGGGLTKVGAGSLFLTGGGTYTGTTRVNAGLLSGSGIIYSPVTVATNATLAVGTSASAIGTFTVNNTVTFSGGSTNLMKVSKTAATNDLITGVSSLTYGGTLVVSNLAGTFVGGESYKLFNASSYSGSFASIVPAIPATGLTWNTNNLGVNGTLSISGGVNTNRTNIIYTVTGSNLNLSWPPDHLGFRLQGQTNAINVGISTNWVTVPGSSSVTNITIPISTTNGSVFFRLVYP